MQCLIMQQTETFYVNMHLVPNILSTGSDYYREITFWSLFFFFFLTMNLKDIIWVFLQKFVNEVFKYFVVNYCMLIVCYKYNLTVFIITKSKRG